MAMVGVRPSCPGVCVCHARTERKSKRAFGVGKRSGCADAATVSSAAFTVCHVASPGLISKSVSSSSLELCRVLKEIGTAKGSGLCGGVVRRGFWDVQDKDQKSRERDARWRCCMGSNDEVLNSEDSSEGINIERGDDEEVEQALHMDGQIPTTSDGFLKRVSSSAYDLRRQFEQNVESSSYDVLDTNPWRDAPKPVYVLAQDENRLLTMRTRRARSEVERELGKLFPKRGSRRGRQGRPSSKRREEEQPGLPPTPSSESDSGFRMLVEDVREGVLVFEDEDDATRYCSLLDGEGKDCTGVAELDASDVFAVCQKTQRLAVLFRRGTTPPQPDRLQLDLKAKRRSLEDQS